MDPPTNNRLKVYVRVRPQDPGQSTIVDIVDEETLIFDPKDAENQPSEYIYHGKKYNTIGAKKFKNSSYSFDKVFDENKTNYYIYETVTRPMIDACINGFNCSVFAYGATGSGKTYTMLGSPSCPGVIHHTSRELFGKLTAISETDPMPAELKICYFEIYNEKIRDLLVPEPANFIRVGNKKLRTTPERRRFMQQPRDTYNLPVCEKSGSLEIDGLSYRYPKNADELMGLLEEGNQNRSQHPTDANADSSRSHAIFQILLTRRTRGQAAEYGLQTSKMSLIDLAGSERASVAYRAGNDRSKNLQREGGNINKSLLALGNCINALADPRRGHKHVPYRNSKLTRLLRDSLGGNCRTAMIATICQQPKHYDDTQNTLVYASRAKCITLRPGRNFTDFAIPAKNYNTIIEKNNTLIKTLQSDNDELKIKLEDMENELNALRAQSRPNQTFIASSFLDDSRFKHRLDQLCEERREIHMEILKYESKFRKNELKLAFKRLDDMRSQVIHGDGLTSTSLETEQSKALKTFYEQERISLLEKTRINATHINDTIASMNAEFEMRGYGSSDEFDSMIETFLSDQERARELEEKTLGEQHAYDIAQDGINRLVATENLLIEAAHVVRYTHAITKGRGLSDPLEAKLSQLFKKLEGKKNVVWKDDKYAIQNDKNHELVSHLLSVHENFSLNFLTPYKNNNTLHSRRLSKNLVSLANYTPEQSANITYDASQ